MSITGQCLLGVALGVIIIAVSYLLERRSCNPQPPAWRARRDSDNHGAE